MDTSGVITVRRLDVDGPGNIQVIQPDNPYYQTYLTLFGGLEPGQTKDLQRVIGTAEMRSDGTIQYRLWSGPAETAGLIRPEDPGYVDFLQRIGGLEPGQTKPVLGQP